MHSSGHSSSAEVESGQVKFTAKYTSKLSFVFHPPSIRAEKTHIKTQMKVQCKIYDRQSGN